MSNIIVRFLDEEDLQVYELEVDKEPTAENLEQERNGLLVAGPPALGGITKAQLFHSDEKDPRMAVDFT